MGRSPSLLLSEATARVDQDIPAAACYLREAIRRSLRNLCDIHHCLPRDHQAQSFIRALEIAGVFTTSRAASVRHLLRIADKATRLYRFRPNRIRRAIQAAATVEQFGDATLA